MGASGANSAAIIAVVGASGNGKGLFIKEQLRRVRKTRGILVWSPLEPTDDYATVIGGIVVDTITALVQAVKEGHKRIVFQPSNGENKTAFDRFCRIAWALEGWVIVVEELSRVTTPSWAPEAWKNLSTAGRHRGVTIYGAMQRPAQCDKDFLGNASEIRCYAVNWRSDAKAMSDVMDEEQVTIRGLPKLHYIHRVMETKTNTRGVVSVPTAQKK
jgi:hypothetical protein